MSIKLSTITNNTHNNHINQNRPKGDLSGYVKRYKQFNSILGNKMKRIILSIVILFLAAYHNYVSEVL